MAKGNAMFCPNCGAQNEDGAAFCTNCGTKFENDEPTVVIESSSSEATKFPATNENVAAQEPNGPEIEFCNYCGAPNEKGSRFCDQCGSPLNVTGGAANPAEMPTSEIPTTAANSAQSDTRNRKKRKHHPAVIAGVTAAIVLACGGVAFAGLKTNWFGLAPTQQEQKNDEASGDSDQDKPKVTVTTSDDGGSPDKGTSSEAKSSDGASATSTSDDDVKASLDAYSWEELKAISRQIAESGSEANAIKIAAKYNLCDSNGSLLNQGSKTITLTNGSSRSVRLVGIYHDTDSNGQKIGLTFLFNESLGLCKWNYSDNNAGGWSNSVIRKSVSTEIYDLLPSDLKNQITPAQKSTNNRGGTDSGTMGAEAVSTTTDTLWIPSFIEVVGTQDGNEGWNAAHGTAQYSWCNNVTKAEGAQYELFEQAGVQTYSPNSILERAYNGSSCDWWVRTANPHMTYDCLKVSANGSVSGDDTPTNSHGIVPGFCI